MYHTTELEEYLALMERRPELFSQSDRITIETDPEKIRKFTEESGKKIGVVYKSSYNMLVTDLIRREDGSYYIYERLIPTEQGGVVTVAQYGDRFVLLNQYRHALRKCQYAFVRGFGERGLSPSENAAKEISEELGAGVLSCTCLGTICADSGLTAAETTAFFCTISEPAGLTCEGIKETLLLSRGELEQMISEGKITDGFTLSAYMLYKAKML